MLRLKETDDNRPQECEHKTNGQELQFPSHRVLLTLIWNVPGPVIHAKADSSPRRSNSSAMPV
jgi:hypothetical protein